MEGFCGDFLGGVTDCFRWLSRFVKYYNLEVVGCRMLSDNDILMKISD